MAVEIIKPKWFKEINAYIATIGGVKYIIDIESKPVMETAQKLEKNAKSATKGGGRKLSDSTKMIKSGASYEEVVKKFPKLTKSNYQQTKKRCNEANGATTPATSASTNVNAAKEESKGTKGGSMAVKADSKPENTSVDPAPAQ